MWGCGSVSHGLGGREVESAAAEDPRAPSAYGPEKDLEVSQ
ncbi:hypothetical protein Pd630_LPD04833 [Rhodococcus opacus PD630]|nr:hypothetical protein Pd630_LPD04833 [Rhodococcus opacus PD630]